MSSDMESKMQDQIDGALSDVLQRIKELEKLNDDLSDKYEEIIEGYIEKNKILAETLLKIKSMSTVVFPAAQVGGDAGAYLRADPVRIIIAECFTKV